MNKMEPSKFCNLFYQEQTLQYAMFYKPITFGFVVTPVTPGFQCEGLRKRFGYFLFYFLFLGNILEHSVNKRKVSWSDIASPVSRSNITHI